MLIAAYQPRLKAFIRKRVPNKEDAEDILQDVFWQFVKASENTLYPIEQVAAWLYRVTRNTIINHGVKKREEPMPDYYEDECEDETDYYLRSLVWAELAAALAELPPEQREIFELTELDDIPVKEIAQASGIPVNTLLSRKHYAVLHLRKRLKDLYEDL
jgi:RNA polymerase sigma factor (sigma-70 family)